MRSLLFAAVLLAPLAQAQFVKPVPADNLNKKAVAALKPPPGVKVAVYVFEDLGCPSCAHNHPIELRGDRAGARAAAAPRLPAAGPHLDV